ncbi:MAG: aryl-sulfate sulfotransferase [Gammaproteobacteria bacterium]
MIHRARIGPAQLLPGAMLWMLGFSLTQAAPPVFEQGPSVIQNPNEAVPLAAILSFETDQAVDTKVTVEDGERTWDIVFDERYSPSEGLPLLGLRAGRTHTLTVTTTNDAGEATTASPLSYETPPLPTGLADFPPFVIVKADVERMEPGIRFLSVRRRIPGRINWHLPTQLRFEVSWGMIVAIDALGEPLWYYESDSRIAGIERLANGNLFFHRTDHRSIEIDMLGNVANEFYAEHRSQGPVDGAVPVDAQSLHHQPHEMPNGNFLAMTANARQIENWYASEYDADAPRADANVVGDRIVEFDVDGKIVWSWDTFDHLDLNRIGYLTFGAYWHVRGFPGHWDWTHGNGVTYDPRDDSVIVSLRNQDAIIKIDRETHEMKWILGTHEDWAPEFRDKLLTPLGEVTWPSHGHNPRVTQDGTIVMFDNGILQARPFRAAPKSPNETFSRGVEYDVDEENMTVRQVWTSAAELTGDSCNSWAMGDTHRLPQTDNMLVIYTICLTRRDGLQYDSFKLEPHVGEVPTHTRIREYTRTDPPEVVSEILVRDENDILQWQVYGGLHVNSLYPEPMTSER